MNKYPRLYEGYCQAGYYEGIVSSMSSTVIRPPHNTAAFSIPLIEKSYLHVGIFGNNGITDTFNQKIVFKQHL